MQEKTHPTPRHHRTPHELLRHWRKSHRCHLQCVACRLPGTGAGTRHLLPSTWHCATGRAVCQVDFDHLSLGHHPAIHSTHNVTTTALASQNLAKNPTISACFKSFPSRAVHFCSSMTDSQQLSIRTTLSVRGNSTSKIRPGTFQNLPNPISCPALGRDQ